MKTSLWICEKREHKKTSGERGQKRRDEEKRRGEMRRKEEKVSEKKGQSKI